MIEINNISKRFGATQALDNVSFTVNKGEVVGFLGANGAGKTTTMDIICGCIGADTGSVKVGGNDILTAPLKVKQNIGYLPDDPPLYYDMKVKDYIVFAAKIHKLKGIELDNRVDYTIKRLMLQEVEHRLIGNLSKGFRQRVGLAQAIVHNPDVLILDEPTEGLDPKQIVEIRELINSLAGEHTIILSSHILSEIKNTCNQLIIIDKGKIVQSGSYEEILASANQAKKYFIKVANNSTKLVGAIADIKGINNSSFCEESNKIHFSLDNESGDSVLDLVTKEVVEGNYGMRELSSDSGSLEDVFFNITN